MVSAGRMIILTRPEMADNAFLLFGLDDDNAVADDVVENNKYGDTERRPRLFTSVEDTRLMVSFILKEILEIVVVVSHIDIETKEIKATDLNYFEV